MLRVFTLSLLLLTQTAPSFAGSPELDLVCLLDNPQKVSGFDVREVIVGKSPTPVTLKRSSEHGAPTIRAKNYAVVIEIIPGEGNEPAREEFYTLVDSEFELQSFSGKRGYHFTDNVNRLQGNCDINGTVSANPAISHGN